MESPSQKNLNLPNILSSLRLLSVPFLVIFLVFVNIEVFRWILLFALISDVLDGLIARTFKIETKLGSILDACADTLVYIVVLVAIPIFKPDFVRDQWLPISIVVGLYLAEKIKCLFTYRTFFNSFHNYLAKLMGYVQGIFILSLFFFGYLWYLFYPAVIVGCLANIEDMIISSLVPKYEHDTKGLYWVLKKLKSERAGA